jgi:hypothetical protein
VVVTGAGGGIKKADVVERPGVFDHVGLLVNGPPGTAGLPFIQSSDDSEINDSCEQENSHKKSFILSASLRKKQAQKRPVPAFPAHVV